MPRSSASEAPLTKQEEAFFKAIDRLLEGKPNHKDLKPLALARSGRKLRLNVVTVSKEAGYARTYVYKNRDAMGRVLKRIEELTRPHKPAPTSADVIARLRAENKQLRLDRDIAIDVTRRWMQETERLRERVLLLERNLAMTSKLPSSPIENVVNFTQPKR